MGGEPGAVDAVRDCAAAAARRPARRSATSFLQPGPVLGDRARELVAEDERVGRAAEPVVADRGGEVGPLVDPVAGVEVGAADPAAHDLEPHLSLRRVALGQLLDAELGVVADDGLHRPGLLGAVGGSHGERRREVAFFVADPEHGAGAVHDSPPPADPGPELGLEDQRPVGGHAQVEVLLGDVPVPEVADVAGEVDVGAAEVPGELLGAGGRLGRVAERAARPAVAGARPVDLLERRGEPRRQPGLGIDVDPDRDRLDVGAGVAGDRARSLGDRLRLGAAPGPHLELLREDRHPPDRQGQAADDPERLGAEAGVEAVGERGLLQPAGHRGGMGPALAVDVGSSGPMGVGEGAHQLSNPSPSRSSSRSHRPGRPPLRSAAASRPRVNWTTAQRSGSGGNGTGLVRT